MRIDEASFVVLDTETTGLSPHQHRIIELAMLRVEGGKIRERFETLINPEQYIPPFIAQYTGITNAMVYGKPSFQEALPEIVQFIEQRPHSVIVGHNVSFDHGFLFNSFERSGNAFTLSMEAGVPHMLCTCKLARRMLPQLTRKSLKHVQDYYGIRNTRQHRAMGDAEATAKILLEFLKLAPEYELELLEDLLRFQSSRVGAPKKTTKKQVALRDQVRKFPERPGVYTMLDRSGHVLYVGKAKSLRDRVSSYFIQSNTYGTKLGQLMRAVREIRYEETGSELSALLLESKRIKELGPRFNSMERRYKSQTFLRLDLQNDFPRLTAVREPGDDGSEYYGPFRSYDSVVALIDVLNRSFTLRECGDDFRPSAKSKPCFYYEIKRCNAPCALRESKEEYAREVERLRQFLAAGEQGVLALVQKMMFEAAERLDFEEAQFHKIRLFELQRVLGRGERPLASLNTNDFVILNRTSYGSCEVLFVRFGRLVKQVVLVSEPPNLEEWFYKQLRVYYGSASAVPPACGKPEIDEMRILSHWAEQRRKKGSTIVYIGENWEDSVARLVRELRPLVGQQEMKLTTPATSKPKAKARKLVAKRVEPKAAQD
jgi:DNA polymerase-3 subunit epsilon